MKVILLSELKGKGGEGDVIDVADGFANNYLFPQGIAVAATKGNLKQLEQRKHNIATREESRIAEANKNKEILENASVKVEARVGEEGVLFGSVTAAMIADAINEQVGLDVDRRRIDPARESGAAFCLHIVFSGFRSSILCVIIHLAHILDTAGAF